MSEDVSKVKKIGMVKYEGISTELISLTLRKDGEFVTVEVPKTEKQIQFINEAKLDGLIICFPTFSEKLYASLLQISKMIDEIPIIVASKAIEKVVELNMGYMGRVGYINYPNSLSEFAKVYDSLANATEIITRASLRHPMDVRIRVAHEDKPAPVTLKDVSLGGAKLHVPGGKIEVGEELIVSLPRTKSPAVLVKAKVLRIEEDAEANAADEQVLGVQFTGLADEKEGKVLQAS